MDMNRHPSRAECMELLSGYQTPEHVRRHCTAVANTALAVARALNDKGFDFDLPLIEAAGLLHDIARVRENHGEVGADFLSELGFEEEAEILRVHMVHTLKTSLGELGEVDMVCLGDRLVKEDAFVGLDERMRHVLAKEEYSSPEAAEVILRSTEGARQIIEQIEAAVGKSIADIVEEGQGATSVKGQLDKLLKSVSKPAKYIGNELNTVIKSGGEVKCRLGFVFPDTYEIGMSYLGLQILYEAANREKNLYCERAFCPQQDMEQLMRENCVPLFTLETKTPLRELDMVGFTLQYEMSFTNILNALDLAGIPLLAAHRSEGDPLVVAGGPCAYNPEPLADFIDVFMIGDGEELFPRLMSLYGDFKRTGRPKSEFYRQIAGIDGIYIPSLYDVEYNVDGTIKRVVPLTDYAPKRVKRAIVDDMNAAVYPVNAIVPIVEVVHDRAVIETFRGCTRGCRFCQAGMIYRPVRERTPERVIELARKQLEATGHDELSLLSLSTSDHSCFEPMVLKLMRMCKEKNVSLSLPSLRLDTFSFNVLREIQGYKRSGLTFAPEAGTQRLRDVINKGVTEKDIYGAVEQALELGWTNIKLYFMTGLPTETTEDLDGIADIAKNIIDLNYKIRGRSGGRFNVTISVSNFVPKAHTPFQWAPQDTREQLHEKHRYLKERLKIKGVTFNYHDTETSRMEGVFARGDRRLGALLLEAFKRGCKFDGWSEFFDYEKWSAAAEATGTDMAFYRARTRSYDEILPWDIIDSGIKKEFLISENEKALKGVTTRDCRKGCVGCGMNERTKCPMGGVYSEQVYDQIFKSGLH